LILSAVTFTASVFVLDSKFTPPEVDLTGCDVTDKAPALSGHVDGRRALSDVVRVLMSGAVKCGVCDTASRLSEASSLPSDRALITDPRLSPAPITGAGTARKFDLVRGVVALDNEEARLTEFRRPDDDDDDGGTASGSGFIDVEVLPLSLGLGAAVGGTDSSRATISD